jgi:hypothetical protein
MKMDKDDKELFEALKEVEANEWKTDNENLFGKPKKKVIIPKKKKRKYKSDVKRRTEIYQPIRENRYYQGLKKLGQDKDHILCGTNEDTIEINEILFRCTMAAKLATSERQVFEWVLFNTTGKKVREVKLNVYRISKDLGISRPTVYRGIQGLCTKKMIFLTTKKRSDVTTIYINTMCNTWTSVGEKIKMILSEFAEEHNM